MKSVIVGLQWGDEGKGRVSGYFAKQYDWSIRFNGACNAGHTVYDDQGVKHKLHHLPAGILFGKKVALDSGMAIDYNKLLAECDLCNAKISDLNISENVHMINETHKDLDKDGSGLGTTKSGIAYVYADRALRKGNRAKDFFKPRMNPKPNIYSGLPPIGTNESALFESAQGIMLDVDYGHYPFVTSSSVMPSMIHKVNKVIGVMKAYTSRVGNGPPYEEMVPELTTKGDEYGTTTGRARRCTWLILEQLRYALSITQPDEIVVTKLDILRDMEIGVWDEGNKIKINGVENYKDFLVNKFPQIKYFSESPSGEMSKV